METYIVFSIFIVANSYFFYNLGLKQGLMEGKFEGMISITQFFKQKNVLKDKNKIIGFKNWPRPIQEIYKDINFFKFKEK